MLTKPDALRGVGNEPRYIRRNRSGARSRDRCSSRLILDFLQMNTHDIELPPLPKASKMYDIPGYDEEELKDYARAAIEADRKRRGEPVSQHPDDAAVDDFAAAMKAKLAKKRAEGRGNWQMCTSTYLSRLLREHVEKGDPVDVANLAMMLRQNGQRIEPAEPCVAPTLHNADSGAQDGIQATQPAEPVKSHLKVSYDDKGDCLYVVCDSNEPADAEEDDKGILYRRAISDGRLIGITVMNFMGPHAKSSDDTPQPAEPDAPAVSDYEAAMADHRRLVRELDVLLNGDGAAEQASLCDIVAQVRREGIKTAEPVKVPSDAEIFELAHDFSGMTFEDLDVVGFARALLARYGKGAP